MYNKITLIGNLTRDPQVRYTQEGTPVVTVSVAVNSTGKDEVLFIDAIFWNKQAEAAELYLTKGKKALIEGRLRQRSWTTEGGEKKYKMEVAGERIVFLSPRDTSAAAAPDAPVEDAEEAPF